VAFALCPLAQQLKDILPAATTSACLWIEDSSVISGIDGRLQQAIVVANRAAKHAEHGMRGIHAHLQQAHDALAEHGMVERSSGGNASSFAALPHFDVKLAPKINFKKLFHEAVCKPLADAVQGQVDRLANKVQAVSDAADAEAVSDAADAEADGEATGKATDTRRLSQPLSLSRTLADWWAAHPGDADVRLEQIERAMAELQGKAYVLLRVAPTAVHSAYKLGGLDAALDAALLMMEAHPTPSAASAASAVIV